MKFESDSIFDREIFAYPEAVLHVSVVVAGAAVVILLHVVQLRRRRDAEKKIAKRRIRELPAEIEVAVIVPSEKSQGAYRSNISIVNAEFERVLPFVPSHVVHSLDRLIFGDRSAAVRRQTGKIRDVDLR